MVNSDVKLKRKVRLRKKVEDQEPIEPNPSESKKPFWMQWWFCAIALVCVVGISILIVKCTGTEGIRITDDKTIETEIVEQTLSEEELDNKDMTEEPYSEEDLSSGDQIAEQSAQSSLTIPTQTTPDMNPTRPSNKMNISNDVEVEAMKVIRGDYGVGQERKDKLGTQYRPIQNRVNQLKREGAF